MRHLALTLALIVAPLLAAPLPAMAQVRSADAVGSVAETRWHGTFDWNNGEHREAELYFRADGVLIYAYGGNTYDNGRWIQRERLITFNTNDYFAVFTGVLDGWNLAGTSYNVGGDRGQFSFSQNAPDAPSRPGTKD